MPNNTTRPHRRHSRLTEIKWFIATLSVAGTLGFWVLFARQWVLQSAANAVPQDTPEAPQQDNTLVLELPPLPTLIPTPIYLPPFVASPQRVVAPLPAVQAQAPQTTGKILLGGEAPSKNNNNNRQGQKKTSTRTRSSQ